MTPNGIIASWKKSADIHRLVSTVMEARLLELVQEAYANVHNMSDWSWKKKESTITTVVGTESYSLAADFRWPQVTSFTLKTSTGTEIFYVDPSDYYKRDRSLANGKPEVWTVQWDTAPNPDVYKIYFYPKPDAAYTIYFPYIAVADTLTGSTTILMPDSHLEAVEALFYAYAFREWNREGKYKEQLAEARTDARTVIARLAMGDRVNVIDGPRDVYGDTKDLNFNNESIWGG